ncbi:MAG: O-antigen ligase family protein [Thermomicrobiales bacterium]
MPNQPGVRATVSRIRHHTLSRAYAGTGVLVIIGIVASTDISLSTAAVLWITAFPVAIWSPLGLTGGLLIAVPWIYVPARIGEWSFSHVELATTIGAAAIAVHLSTAIARHRGWTVVQQLLQPVRITLPALALLVTAAFSLRYVADPAHLGESVREFRTVIVGPLLAFLIFRWTLASPLANRYAITCLVGSGAIVAVRAIVGDNVIVADGVSRITGPYPHPNNLALYLERVTLVGAAVVITGRRSSSRWQWAFVVLTTLCGLGTVLTASRGGILALVAGGLAIAKQTERRYSIAVLAGFSTALSVALLFGRGRLTATGGTGGEFTRLPIWRSSLEMIRDYPLTGVGLDQFLYQYLPRYVEPVAWPERFTSHPHNVLLDLWLRLGILGPVLGLWLLAAIWTIRRSTSSAPDTAFRSFQIAGTTALLGSLVHGMVDNSFFLPDLAVLTWFFVALVERSTESAR